MKDRKEYNDFFKSLGFRVTRGQVKKAIRILWIMLIIDVVALFILIKIQI